MKIKMNSNRGIMWRQIKGNKYGNIERVYNGRIYHSKKEAEYAFELDIRKKAGEIKEWIPQYKINLKVNGYHIANYYVDFKVIMANGSEELHEVKGFSTEVWRLKWKLTEALFGDEYNLVVIK